MITVLIPTGDYPFFVDAICANIKETCGVPLDQIDLAFVITKDASEKLRGRLARTGFRILEAPFSGDTHGIHLKLLDWALKFGTDSKWVYVQHMDMFWKEHNMPWMKTISREIDGSEEIALTVPDQLSEGEFEHKWNKFSLDGRILTRTHDFAGVYNRQKLLDMKLSFEWGSLQNLVISEQLRDAVNKKRIRWIHRNEDMRMEDWLDGSDLIGLEIAVRCPKQIRAMDISNPFIHSWDMFNLASNMKREGNTIRINRELRKSTRSFSSYSWIGSHLFDKDEMRDKILPWPFVKILSKHATVTCEKTKICCLLEKYTSTKNIAGDDDYLGVEKVEFNDFSLRRQKMFL